MSFDSTYSLAGDSLFSFECSEIGAQCGAATGYIAYDDSELYFIGAPGAKTSDGSDPSGVVYLLYRDQFMIPSGVIRSNDVNDGNGGIIEGVHPNGKFGSSIDSIEYFNGQEKMSFFISEPESPSKGVVHAVIGKPNYPDLDAYSINDISDLKIFGEAANDRFGELVRKIDDVSGDDKPDLLIYAPGARSAYVLFSNVNFGTSFNVADLDGSNGFKISNLPADVKFGVGGALMMGVPSQDKVFNLLTGGGNQIISFSDIEAGRSYGCVIEGHSGTNFGSSVSLVNGVLSIGAPNTTEGGAVYMASVNGMTLWGATYNIDQILQYWDDAHTLHSSISGGNLGESIGYARYYDPGAAQNLILAPIAGQDKIFVQFNGANVTDVGEIDGSHGFLINGDGSDNYILGPRLSIGSPEYNNAGKAYLFNFGDSVSDPDDGNSYIWWILGASAVVAVALGLGCFMRGRGSSSSVYNRGGASAASSTGGQINPVWSAQSWGDWMRNHGEDRV